MKHITLIIIIFILLFSITSASCNIFLGIPLKRVSVYSIPLENTYHVDVKLERLKSHRDVNVSIYKNRDFYKSLNRIALNIIHSQPQKQFSFDTRVLLEYKNKKGNLVQIELDKFGRIKIGGKFYESNKIIISIIEKYTA